MASCSRRSTRGSPWRSATSRTRRGWRYVDPDAPSVCFSPCRRFPEPRQKPTSILKRPQRLQICREAKECRCYEGNGRRLQPRPEERCGKWVVLRGGLLTLEAGMFEPLCFVQAANFLIDTQISLSCLFMAESAPL